MNLSVCMIVRDEAARLGHCLESVATIADEVIVVDTGSQDETVAIAQQAGAKVFHYEWQDDFAAARNYSLQQAQGDWVLVIDADELLATTIVPALVRVMQQPDVLLVNLVRQELGATQAPYSLVSRLFRRHPGVVFSRPYHELVDDSVSDLMIQDPSWRIITVSEVAIFHEGYRADLIADRHKPERARRILEQAVAATPTDAYLCSKLGALYIQAGELTRGVALLEQGLKTKPQEAMVRYELYYHLGLAYSRVQDVVKASAHYRHAIDQPVIAQVKLAAYNNLGSLLEQQGNLAGAKDCYERVIGIDPNLALGHFNLAVVLKALDNIPVAIEHYKRALLLDPYYAPAYRNYGALLLKLGQVDSGMNCFRQAIALYRQNNSPEADQLQKTLAEMGFRL